MIEINLRPATGELQRKNRSFSDMAPAYTGANAQ